MKEKKQKNTYILVKEELGLAYEHSWYCFPEYQVCKDFSCHICKEMIKKIHEESK